MEEDQNGEPADSMDDKRLDEEDLVNDAANDHRLSTLPGKETDGGGKYHKGESLVQQAECELPITHLKNPENRRVFDASPELMKRRDLIPCDKNGIKVHDYRCF